MTGIYNPWAFAAAAGNKGADQTFNAIWKLEEYKLYENGITL